MKTLTIRDMPTDKRIGDVFTSGDYEIVRTTTGGAFVPKSLATIEKAAARAGWGVKREVFCDSYGPVIFLSVGRNPGVVGDTKKSTRGVTYRLRWDLTKLVSKFALVTIHVRSTDSGGTWEHTRIPLDDLIKEIEDNEVKVW